MNVIKTKLYDDTIEAQIAFLKKIRKAYTIRPFLNMLKAFELQIIHESEIAGKKFAIGSGTGQMLKRGPSPKPFGWSIYFKIVGNDLIFHYPRDPRRDPAAFEELISKL